MQGTSGLELYFVLEQRTPVSSHQVLRMLTYAHVCSRMLTYAHVCALLSHRTRFFVCSRMRTYAHVCSPRMQTYADVCALLSYVTAGSSDIVSTPPDKQLTCAHVCSRMLTYADRFFGYPIDTARQATYHCSVRQVCSRMLTYAHACSRMLTTSNILLTYADA